MAKIVTMHQPNYLPWIGLFSKISQTHTFIIYDNAQYTLNGVINRNRIRTAKGFSYLTIPISRGFYEDKILDVTLPENRSWQENHWKTIYQNYAKTRFFREHRDFFEELYREDLHYLWQLNEKILLYLLKRLKIEVEVLRASEMGIDTKLKKTEAILAYLKKAGAGMYVSGPSGRDYLEFERFPQNNIALRFFKFQHPIYPQRYPGFEPNLSIIDLLFNMGPEASRIVKTSGSLED